MKKISNHQAGMTLIELLISMTISAIIISGMLQLFASSRNNSSINLRKSTIQDNLRFLMSQLELDAAQVGGMGCFSYAFRKNQNYVGDILLNDNEGSNSGSGLPRYDVSKLLDGSDNNGLLSSDTVLFRYAPSSAGIPVLNYDRGGNTPDQITLDLSSTAAKQSFTDIEQYDVLLAADCSGAVYFMVTNNPTNTPTDSEILEFKSGITAPSNHVNAGQGNRTITGSSVAKLEDENEANNFEDNVIVGDWSGDNAGFVNSTRPYVYSTSSSRAVVYSIGDSITALELSAACTADTPEYCALQRDGVEIAEGVEAFQVEYGWHINGDEDGAIQFGSASAVPNNQWDHIDRLRISITLNSVTPVWTGNGDELVRRSYVRTIALRNQIGD